MSRFDYLAEIAVIGIKQLESERLMTPDKIALLFYMTGSLCFLVGSIVLFFSK